MKLRMVFFLLILSLFYTGLYSQTITILSPNGGENLLVGDIELITWTWTGTIDSVKVEYSTNSGGTWTIIETKTLNDSICGWNVPNKPGNLYLAKVTDASNASILDISDNLFSLSSSIDITSPVGGDNWETGNLETITWDATDGIPDVKLEYSTNAGSNWTSIKTSTPNNGFYPWNVPNKPTNIALIRITDTDNSSVLDMSDLFNITTSLTVTSPNGGENWDVGTSQNITWNASPGISKVKIEVSTNGGGSWTSLVTSIFNTGVYGWKIPNSPYNTYRIKITDVDNATITDMSNNNFSVTSSINVIYPNGGEVFVVGEEQIISYGATSGISELKIQYSTNNGSNWTSIVTAANDSSIIWNIPNKPSTQCLVRITDNAVATVYDVSDDTFAIDTTGAKVEEEKKDKPIPGFFSQSQSIPNPFSRETVIRYAIPEDCRVVLKIYDIRGKLVKTLVDEDEKTGYKIVRWNGTDDKFCKLPTGVYFYRIKAGRFTDTKKFVLLN